jgi:hypothetical protein
VTIGRVFVAPLRDRETLLGCGETPFMLPERPFAKDKESLCADRLGSVDARVGRQGFTGMLIDAEQLRG